VGMFDLKISEICVMPTDLRLGPLLGRLGEVERRDGRGGQGHLDGWIVTHRGVVVVGRVMDERGDDTTGSW